MGGQTVLVTGGTGFVGVHCVARLLQTGVTVRTTVRTSVREQQLRAMLRAAGVSAGDSLHVVVADLTADEGWSEATTGCDAVLHVASPFPASRPRHEDELVVPARDGALRVLRAARDAGVRRVVLTSSFASISYGHASLDRVFTEQDWTNLDGHAVSAYAKSKTLAERVAWDFVEREGDPFELAVVNPVGILGPALGSDLSTSMLLIQRLLDRDIPALPRLSYSFVDVRDVVDLHLRAMSDPAAAGERFLAVAGEPLRFAEVAQILRSRLGPAAARVPTREAPDWLVRLVSRTDPTLRMIAPELGKVKQVTAEKARRVLGWSPRSPETSIVDSARSLLELGVLKVRT